MKPILFLLVFRLVGVGLGQEVITFTNRQATFTNLQGKVFRDVRLVRADNDGIIYYFSEGVGGGRVFYTNLTAAVLESLGIPADRIAAAKTPTEETGAGYPSWLRTDSFGNLDNETLRKLQGLPPHEQAEAGFDSTVMSATIPSVAAPLAPPRAEQTYSPPSVISQERYDKYLGPAAREEMREFLKQHGQPATEKGIDFWLKFNERLERKE